MASALVCGASSTVRHSALFPSFQMHQYRERVAGSRSESGMSKGAQEEVAAVGPTCFSPST